jgi:uncharacterized membrane protein YoaK (UPF0700 family)
MKGTAITTVGLIGPGHIAYEELGLASLSLASGCTDVLSFLKLGDLFTSAMTGNTALFAIAVGRGQMLVASRGLTALLGFMLGAALATVIYAPGRAEQNARRRLRHLLLLETVFLGGCAALWSVSRDPVQGSALYAVILLSAVSMGIQGVVGRLIDVSGISTIVFTSVLISIAMSLTRALARPASASASWAGVRAHLGTFAAYGCGAALAGILVSRYFGGLLWVPMAAVLLALGCSELAGHLERRAK